MIALVAARLLLQELPASSKISSGNDQMANIERERLIGYIVPNYTETVDVKGETGENQ